MRAELGAFTTGYSFHSKPPNCRLFRGVNLLNSFDVQPQVSPVYVVVFLTVLWQPMLVAAFLSRFLTERNDPSDQL